MSTLQVGVLFAAILAVIAALSFAPRKAERRDAVGAGGIAPNDYTLALIRMLCRARFQRMHRIDMVDPLEADANIKQVATLPAHVLMGIPEATIVWICTEYQRLTQSGIARPLAIQSIEAHRAVLTGVNVAPSIRTRWLRSYVADRVIAEHSEIPHLQDFAMLAAEYLAVRLSEPQSSKDEHLEILHPMASPMPFGVLESAQLYVETLQSAIESLDRKNPTEALDKIGDVLNGPDAEVLRDSDRRRLLEEREKLLAMR